MVSAAASVRLLAVEGVRGVLFVSFVNCLIFESGVGPELKLSCGKKDKFPEEERVKGEQSSDASVEGEREIMARTTIMRGEGEPELYCGYCFEVCFAY